MQRKQWNEKPLHPEGHTELLRSRHLDVDAQQEDSCGDSHFLLKTFPCCFNFSGSP